MDEEDESLSATLLENGSGKQQVNFNHSNVFVGQQSFGSFSTTNDSFKQEDLAGGASPGALPGYSIMFDDIYIDHARKPLTESSRVFKGYQMHATGQKTDVAIKMIAPFTEKNLREVQHLVDLTPHENVVRIIRSKKCEGRACPELFIVMELCKSETLKEYCRKDPFDFENIISDCRQILNGIKHIHNKNIIHGDLKPENILFSLDGKSMKVADFGISKQLRKGASKTKLTSPGTDSFRAPETSNSDIISLSADIFSLGIVLFGMFTNGKHPFGQTPHVQLYNIAENKGYDLSGLPEEMENSKKSHLCNMLQRMFEYNPKNRPTIDEVLKDVFFTSSDTIVKGDGGSGPTSVEPVLRAPHLLNNIKLVAQASEKSNELAAQDEEKTRTTLDKRQLEKNQLVESKSGGKLKLGGSSIAIPPGCLKRDVQLEMIVGSKSFPNLPQNTIMLSSEVGCDFSQVKLFSGAELKFTIFTYCYSTKELPILLLRKACGETDWILDKSMELCANRMVQFKTSALSKCMYCVAITQHQYLNAGKYLTYPIYVHLYLNEGGMVKYYATVADAPLMDMIRHDNEAGNFWPLLSALEPVDAKLGELFGVDLQCLRPPSLAFRDDKLSKFLADDVISNGYVCRSFKLEASERLEGFVSVQYTLIHLGDDTSWPIRTDKRLDEPTMNKAVTVQTVTGHFRMTTRTAQVKSTDRIEGSNNGKESAD